MKPKLFGMLGVGLLVLGLLAAVCIKIYADSEEWELKNRIPSVTLADSQRNNIFVSDFTTNDKIADLEDSTHEVESVWIEHAASPIRLHWWKVKLVVEPAEVLCIRIRTIKPEKADGKTVLTILFESEVRTISCLPTKRTVCFPLKEEKQTVEFTLLSPSSHKKETYRLTHKI
jgi:hypothetical protein